VSFYRERPIKSVRKARPCYGCGVLIAVGEPALECSGKQDDFWSGTYHSDCRGAEEGLNGLRETSFYDDWNLLSEIEWDEWPWLLEKHPTVAVRMKITAERFLEVSAERERVRLAWAEIDRKRREPAQ
jgi:hypothetical protein